jgi:segregation and condensation protein B|nr:MAG: hypothetical protein KatS3mg041_0015 [Bacteroidota bacterium]
MYTLEQALEALLFVAPEPVSLDRLLSALEPDFPDLDPGSLQAACLRLNALYAQTGRVFRIRPLAGGWELRTEPEFGPLIERFLAEDRRVSLSPAAMEVLAIIAYRQPITRPEIEAIRGAGAEHALRRLLELDLIRVVGRKTEIGRPLLYATTDRFLAHFGLQSLDDLPKLRELESLLSEEHAHAAGQTAPTTMAEDLSSAPSADSGA